ncbi:MAG: hypothetical protein RL660_2370 [Bacteroidota bacterium]|jgi:hypothetical protein
MKQLSRLWLILIVAAIILGSCRKYKGSDPIFIRTFFANQNPTTDYANQGYKFFTRIVYANKKPSDTTVESPNDICIRNDSCFAVGKLANIDYAKQASYLAIASQSNPVILIDKVQKIGQYIFRSYSDAIVDDEGNLALYGSPYGELSVTDVLGNYTNFMPAINNSNYAFCKSKRFIGAKLSNAGIGNCLRFSEIFGYQTNNNNAVYNSASLFSANADTAFRNRIVNFQPVDALPNYYGYILCLAHSTIDPCGTPTELHLYKWHYLTGAAVFMDSISLNITSKVSNLDIAVDASNLQNAVITLDGYNATNIFLKNNKLVSQAGNAMLFGSATMHNDSLFYATTTSSSQAQFMCRTPSQNEIVVPVPTVDGAVKSYIQKVFITNGKPIMCVASKFFDANTGCTNNVFDYVAFK